MSANSLVDRLRSVLEVYYDWVQVESTGSGIVRIRVGKRNPTKRDLEEFMLRVTGEVQDGEVRDVELKAEAGEIAGSVFMNSDDKKDPTDVVEQFEKYAGALIERSESETVELTRFLKIPMRTVAAIFEGSRKEILERYKVIVEMLESAHFYLVDEGDCEDIYVSPSGMMARVGIFETPYMPSSLRAVIYLPKSLEDAFVVRRRFGFDEEFLDPNVAKEAGLLWRDFSRGERLEFLLRKAGLKQDRAQKWSDYSFDEILDMHPFLAQRIAKELIGVRI